MGRGGGKERKRQRKIEGGGCLAYIKCWKYHVSSFQASNEMTPRETEKGEVRGFCHSGTSSLGR